MSAIPTAILQTLLAHLAILFLPGATDIAEARSAAQEALAFHNPRNLHELRIAAKIISFDMLAIEALSFAATPDMPLNKAMRLRGSAVSLSRESDKATAHLDRIQAVDPAVSQPEAEPADDANPRRIDNAIAFIEATRDILAAQSDKTQSQQPVQPNKDQPVPTPPANTPPIWSNAYRQQQNARKITETLKRNQAVHQAANQTAVPPAQG